MSVIIRSYTGTIEATCCHPALDALCEQAAQAGLPGIGNVDKYDDTVFNRSQMRLVIPELTQLSLSTTPVAEAAEEVLALARTIERKNHRYLVFNGD
ncbi:hypothetical protein ACIQCR_34860 [Streptomyces sp. NPDC093249]|uniref:hypothetical protein n=1 Tax=unclassified Streptomyces TaxID=2593676 RepID=UPI0038195F00